MNWQSGKLRSEVIIIHKYWLEFWFSSRWDLNHYCTMFCSRDIRWKAFFKMVDKAHSSIHIPNQFPAPYVLVKMSLYLLDYHIRTYSGWNSLSQLAQGDNIILRHLYVQSHRSSISQITLWVDSKPQALFNFPDSIVSMWII